MGFQKIHPENVPKKRKVSKDEKRRFELANKLIPLKKISTADKAEIYKILTGEDYPAKRGRPSEGRRNFQAAIDFLYLMGETTESTKEEITRTLAIKYNLPGGATNLDSPERDIDDVNFNKIVVQQLDKLESYFRQHVDAVENGLLENKGESYKNSKICLQGLTKYKASLKRKKL